MENVVIIGGGPAGLAAALYTARAGLKPLVLSGSPPGGQLSLTTEVENYLGFESIMGAELIEKFRNHAKKFGARIVDENVIKVDLSKRPFKITLNPEAVTKIFSRDQLVAKNTPQTTNSQKNFVTASSVIIATGAKALWLGLESEKKLRGKGVSACATCDGFFFRNKIVAVIGGGDTALEEAITLSKFAAKVYLIHRRDSFRASKVMQEEVFNNKKIEVVWNAQVEEIVGVNKVEEIRLKVGDPTKIIPQENSLPVKSSSSDIHLRHNFVKSPQSKTKNIKLDGVFIAIGHKPDTDLFKGQIEMDEKGYIKTKRSMTSVDGVFAAGDCADYLYRQASYAMGMGVAAALEVERWLNSK